MQQCEDPLGQGPSGAPPHSQAGATNLDEVLVDPLGEGFLLHTVPLIWGETRPINLGPGKSPGRPQEVTMVQHQSLASQIPPEEGPTTAPALVPTSGLSQLT